MRIDCTETCGILLDKMSRFLAVHEGIKASMILHLIWSVIYEFVGFGKEKVVERKEEARMGRTKSSA